MRKRWLLIGAILLLSLPLALLLRNLAWQPLWAQLVRIGWFIRLLVQSVPQTIIWAVFLGVALLLVLISLTRRQEPAQQELHAQRDRLGDIASMAQRVQRSLTLGYSRRSLARYMRTLALEVLAYQHRSTAERMRRQLRDGTLDVPPEIRAYLDVEHTSGPERPLSFWARLKRRLARPPAAPMDPELERIVHFLEASLHIEPRAGDRVAVEAYRDH